MKTTDIAKLGKKGERVAARYLKKHGYRILARNRHFSHNELDLVVKNKECVAFVEVKSRRVKESEIPYTRPAFAVDKGKRSRTLAAALDYLKVHPTRCPFRFDIVEVYFTADKRPSVSKITHIEDAFGADGIHR